MPPAMSAGVFRTGEASLQRRSRNHHKCRNRARIGRICLECAAIFGHLPLTIRCRLGDYTRAMMIKRILTICAAVCAVWRLARQEPRSRRRSRAIRSTRAGLFAGPAGLSAEPTIAAVPARRISTRWKMTRAERADSTALPPPGPVLSPDDPRYGRPMGAPPVYSDRGVPTGPVLSPDDPRYGRPMARRRSIPTATADRSDRRR